MRIARVAQESGGVGRLLLNYTHQPAATPYHASHAIFVREEAGAAYDQLGAIPQVMRSRVMSLRAFDGQDLMVDAQRGCYAARIERAPP